MVGVGELLWKDKMLKFTVLPVLSSISDRFSVKAFDRVVPLDPVILSINMRLLFQIHPCPLGASATNILGAATNVFSTQPLLTRLFLISHAYTRLGRGMCTRYPAGTCTIHDLVRAIGYTCQGYSGL